MSNYWMIKQVGNGYVVDYPYRSPLTTEEVVLHGTLFTSTFEGALKLCENNSLLPTPEDALKSK